MEFDHESAYIEVAKPAFEALPEKIKLLFATTSLEMASCKQNKDLGLDWPIDGSLKKVFECFDSLTLSKASRAIYFCGHWGSSKQAKPDLWPEKAQSWKFALLADQILCERSGLVRGNHPKGISYAIHEGLLRVCCSGNDYWVWEEIGSGTPENLDRAKVIMETGKESFLRNIDCYEANMPTCKAELWDDADLFKDIGDRYRKTRHAIDAQKAEAQTIEERENLKAKMQKDFDQKMADLAQKGQEKLTVKFWLIDHGIPLDNCIWYEHKKMLCFGWREYTPFTEADKEALLPKLKGAFFEYEFKVN